MCISLCNIVFRMNVTKPGSCFFTNKWIVIYFLSPILWMVFSVQLEKCLKSKDLVKYDERVQEECIQLADIEGFVKCPSCDFGALLDPGDKVFKCQKSDCMKVLFFPFFFMSRINLFTFCLSWWYPFFFLFNDKLLIPPVMCFQVCNVINCKIVVIQHLCCEDSCFNKPFYL